MNARQWRQRGLFGALATTVVLTAVSGKGESPASRPTVAPRPAVPPVARRTVQPLPRVELERLPRPDAPADSELVATNTFGAMSWHVAPPPPPPPPPPARPPPPPPPSAPPVPFSFMGRYEDGKARIILLVKDDRIYTVSEGDIIDKTYRVERLTAGLLELTYLPLGTRQTIPAGGT